MIALTTILLNFSWNTTHIKLSRLILKKVKTEFFNFLSPEKPKNHKEPLWRYLLKNQVWSYFEKVSKEYSHMTGIRLIYQLFHLNRTSLTYRDIASFSTSCRPGWLSFPHILKIARMTRTHWPHQHFELLCFFSSPQQRIIYYKR